MKSLRNLLATIALTCALCVSAFAGEIGTQGYAPGEIGTQGIATGNMDTDAAATTPGKMDTVGIAATDPALGVALSLLQSVLVLF